MSSKRGTSFDSTLSQRVKRKEVAALWKRVAAPGMGGMWPLVEACAKLLAPSFTVCVLGCVAQHRFVWPYFLSRALQASIEHVSGAGQRSHSCKHTFADTICSPIYLCP